MNYYNQYRPYSGGSNRIPKQQIQPYGIYKISTYNYADGSRKSLKGADETLIFVTGVYQKKVSALKLSNIQPIKFFNWFKRVANNVVDEETLSEKTGLYEIETPMDIGGNRIYDSYIKSNRDFVAKGAAYRTYKLDGISYASEVFLNTNTIKKYYG